MLKDGTSKYNTKRFQAKANTRKPNSVITGGEKRSDGIKNFWMKIRAHISKK